MVVGQPDWETPELGSPIFRLVANPPWTVPELIAEEEILPKGAAYMAKENIVMKNGRLVQEPGPKSALGLVKFDMDNDEQIYLHDTPAKALFAAERAACRATAARGSRMRSGSPGCSPRTTAGSTAFDKALATGEETPVAAVGADPGAAPLPQRLCRRRPGGVPDRPLWLGRQGRRRARPGRARCGRG